MLISVTLRMILIVAVTVGVWSAIPGPTGAAVPEIVSYQGRLTDSAGGPVPDGDYAMTFTIYDSADGGSILWSSELQMVPVASGLFSYDLGAQMPLPDGLFSDGTARYLGIMVEGDAEILPRIHLASVAYAYQALRSDSAGYAMAVADGAIDTPQLANYAVTTQKIAIGAVGSDQLGDGSIQFIDIGPNNAAPGQVMKWDGQQWVADNDEMAAGGSVHLIIPGEGIEVDEMAPGEVEIRVADAGITENKLSPGAVTNEKIAAGAVTASEIAPNTITAGQIAGNAITASEIAPNTITAGEILSSTITGNEIAPAAISSSEIADSSVGTADLADSAVTGAKIAAGAVDSIHLASGAVTSAGIKDGSIAGVDLALSSVDSTRLATNAVTGLKIAAGAVSAAKLADTAVTKDKIAKSAVDSTKLEANAVTSEKIDNGTIGFVDIGRNTASDGQVMKWSNAKGSWAPANDSLGAGGDITGVWGGTGLSGGSDTGSVTLSVDFGGNGSATTSAHSDHDHDSAYIGEGQVNSITTGMITNGEIKTADLDSAAITSVKLAAGAVRNGALADSAVTRSKLLDAAVNSAKLDSNAVTSQKITDGTISFDDIGQNSADTGQVIKWNGDVWIAANDSLGTGAGGGGWADDGSVVRLETANDSVGIGTASPTEKLDVVGNLHASGTISSGSSITIEGSNWEISSSSGFISFDDDDLQTTGKARIGLGNTNAGTAAFVAGGSNSATGDYSAVGGGGGNVADSNYSVISGGSSNSAQAYAGTIGGGENNRADSSYAVVGGGQQNIAGHFGAVVGGGGNNRANGDHSVVSGGQDNTADSARATVGGGGGNRAVGEASTVGGGHNNQAGNPSGPPWAGRYSTVSGGQQNVAYEDYASVGGGFGNNARGRFSVIAGGGGDASSDTNSAQGAYSAIGGGGGNITQQDYSVVGGGRNNMASGSAATVPGGAENKADGEFALAAGYRAKANHAGSFVWADQTDIDFQTTGDDQFLIRATGGVGVGTNFPQGELDVNGTTRTQSFEMPTGAQDGYVLTSDSDGVATWQPAASSSYSDSLFWVFDSWASSASNQMLVNSPSPGTSRYITGISMTITGISGWCQFSINGSNTILYLYDDEPGQVSWSSGGGAPFKLTSSETLRVSVGMGSSTVFVTVTGYDE